ncbi:hypothetical protein JTB14_027377 [Gonioctena quinquepunctata]|nr:hypothetical protein JTB14_027377 [Gonioctena quinquepunctata]
MEFKEGDLYTTHFTPKKDKMGKEENEDDDLEIDDSTPQITFDQRNILTVTDFENFESLDLKELSGKVKSKLSPNSPYVEVKTKINH